MAKNSGLLIGLLGAGLIGLFLYNKKKTIKKGVYWYGVGLKVENNKLIYQGQIVNKSTTDAVIKNVVLDFRVINQSTNILVGNITLDKEFSVPANLSTNFELPIFLNGTINELIQTINNIPEQSIPIWVNGSIRVNGELQNVIEKFNIRKSDIL